MREKHTTGELAYIDSFSGLIPCKVMDIAEDGKEMIVRVTANRPGWYRGDICLKFPKDIIPRKSVFVRCGQYHIRNNYFWSK